MTPLNITLNEQSPFNYVNTKFSSAESPRAVNRTFIIYLCEGDI